MSEMIDEDVIRTETLEMDRGEREEMMVDIYESSDAVRNDEVMINTEMMSTERLQELQHTGRVSVKNRRHRSVQVCLCLLSVLLFNAVLVICVYFNNKTNQLLTHNYNLTKKREELLTHNYNLTKEKEKCSSLLLNQSRILTEEREKFRNKSDELQAASQEKKQLILQINKLTKKKDGLLKNTSQLINEKKQCLMKTKSLSEERDQLLANNSKLLKKTNNHLMQITSLSEVRDKKTEAEDLKRWLTEQDRRSDNFEWIYYNFSFYYISSDQKIWSESRRDCEERGADLLIINNKEEQEFVQKATTSGQYYYWIGLSKDGGVWKWVDGTTLTLSFWKNGSSYNHSCASADASGWTDYQCNSLYRRICEKSVFKTPGQKSA